MIRTTDFGMINKYTNIISRENIITFIQNKIVWDDLEKNPFNLGIPSVCIFLM